MVFGIHHDGSGGGVDIDQLLELSLVRGPVVIEVSHLVFIMDLVIFKQDYYSPSSSPWH